MKKLLTVLLTLVMAVCLINLNNSHTKADEENNVYVVRYDYDTFSGITGLPPTIGAGHTIKISNELSSTKNVVVNLIDGTTKTIAPGSSWDLVVAYKVKQDDITNNNSNGTITILDGIKCTGLTYDGTEWKDNGVSADPSYYGITMSGNTATFTKNIYNTTADTVIQVDNDLNIVLGNNIVIASMGNGILLKLNNANVSIDGSADGDVYSLTLGTVNNVASTCEDNGETLTLKNIKLTCKNKNDGGLTFDIDNLILGDNCDIKLTNFGIEDEYKPAALAVYESITGDDKYDILGSTNPTPASINDLKVAIRNTDAIDPDYGLYQVQGDTDALENAVYILIKQKEQPQPSPSKPVVKDESCEKVIGPTWHWNNDKGICEDYGVVGTATR